MGIPPGQLPTDQVEALVAPYEEFAAFVADMTTIRVVTELRELSREGHTIRAFNLIHTNGSAGGIVHGESGFRIFAAELPGAPRPPVKVVRKGFGTRLRHLFGAKVSGFDSPAFEAAFFVVARDADAAKATLAPDAIAFLGRARPDVDIEVRGHHVVAHRKGTVAGEDQEAFIDELAPLVPLLARGGYRG